MRPLAELLQLVCYYTVHQSLQIVHMNALVDEFAELAKQRSKVVHGCAFLGAWHHIVGADNLCTFTTHRALVVNGQTKMSTEGKIDLREALLENPQVFLFTIHLAAARALSRYTQCSLLCAGHHAHTHIVMVLCLHNKESARFVWFGAPKRGNGSAAVCEFSFSLCRLYENTLSIIITTQSWPAFDSRLKFLPLPTFISFYTCV